MTPHEQLDRRGRDLARLITVVVELLIVQVALAAIERPAASTTLASLGSGVFLWFASRRARPRAGELTTPAELALDVTALSVPFAIEGVVAHLGPADRAPAATPRDIPRASGS